MCLPLALPTHHFYASCTEERGDREFVILSTFPSLTKLTCSEDKSEHAGLARRLAQLTSFAVAVPNYRLTKPETPHRHPAHAEDLLQFLDFVLGWEGPQGVAKPYDASRIYVFGHSCSAHMLTSILLTPPADSFPTLAPSTRLLESVHLPLEPLVH